MDFFGKIKVGSNVYIGNNTLILPGVTIGDDVVIAAGSVVTKSVPSSTIIGGNPAKVIGHLEDFERRMFEFNIDTKGMNDKAKKDYLLSLPEDKFIRK